MKKLVVLLGLMTLAGCVEQPAYLVHKTGSNYADRMRARDACEFQAIQAVPRAMATQVSGGFYNPGTLQCSTVGTFTNCNRVGAVNIPATATTYDANQELRDRYIGRCLADRGYSIVPKPVCTTEQQRQTFRATLDNQPPASQIACIEARNF